MKKQFYYWTVATLLAAFLFSCNQYDDDYILVSETEVTFEGAGGQESVVLEVNGAWMVIEHPEWCVPTPDQGIGSSEMALTAGYNSEGEREGVLRIQRGDAVATITIIQKEVIITSISLDKAGLAFDASGGEESVRVTSDGAWTISELPEWCVFSQHSGNGGIEYIQVTIDANEEEEGRSVIVKFTTETSEVNLTIAQAGKIIPFVTLNKEEVPFGYEGGSEVITITGSGGPYTVEVPDWCDIELIDAEEETGEIIDGGNGKYTLKGITSFRLVAKANESKQAREYTATVSNEDAEAELLIKQDAAPEDILILSKEELTFTHEGGEQKVTLTANGAWEIAFDPEWCTVTPAAGTGNAEITITAKANAGAESRETILTIERGDATKEIKVTQGILPLTLDKTELTLVYGLALGNVKINAAGAWSVTSQIPDWLKIDPASGTGATEISVSTIKMNYNTTARTAAITFADGQSTVTLNVTQEGANREPYITLSKDGTLFYGEGGDEIMYIESNVVWTVSGATDWCTIVPVEGNSSGSFTVTTTRNETGAERVATIRFSFEEIVNATLTVTQKELTEEPASISVSPGILEFKDVDSGKPVNITVNGPWEIVSHPDWCYIEDYHMQGSVSTEIYIGVTTNTDAAPREGVITIKRGDATATLTVKQREEGPYIQLNPSKITFGAERDEIVIDVDANGEWTVTQDYDSWLWVDSSGTGSGKILIDVLQNEGAERKHTVEFVRGTAKAYLEIIQEGATAVP